jgi:general secretion pathway protein M
MTGYIKRCSPREQLLLLVCAVLVSVTVFWLMLWQPVMNARLLTESRLVFAQQSLAQVNTLAAELEYLRQSNVDASVQVGVTESLPQMLNALSAQMGITVASLEPAAGNLSAGVRFDAVVMQNLLAWLAELEAQAGIELEQITISPVSATDTGVSQSVNATLRVRSLQ